MKKLLIIFTVLLMMSYLILAFAELSDETLDIVDDLRWKHSGWICIDDDSICFFDEGYIEWTRDFFSMWVEGDRLFVETQDGKWFIEMNKLIKE